MKNFFKCFLISISFLVLTFSCASAPNGPFVFNIDKSSVTESIRVMEMDAQFEMEFPDEKNQLKTSTAKTLSRYEAKVESKEEIANKNQPGEFLSSEKIISAKYSFLQNRNRKGDNSITLIFKDNKITVEDINANFPLEAGQPGFEDSAKETFNKLLAISDSKGKVKIDKFGRFIDIEADMSVKRNVSQAMQSYSGLVFPEGKVINVGDKWVEKKVASYLSGFQILGNPVEIEVIYEREADQKLNGKTVAVFRSSVSFEKKGVNGIYAGYYTVFADITSKNDSIFFYDKSKKTLVKSETLIKDTLVNSSLPNQNQSPIHSPYKIKIDIKNTTSIERTQKN